MPAGAARSQASVANWPHRLPPGAAPYAIVAGEGVKLQQTVKAVVHRRTHVAECVEIAVVTQGATLDETLANLQEAVALHLEGEYPADFGLVPQPTFLVTMEL